MKKTIIFSLIAPLTFAAVFFVSNGKAQAQAVCPTGYVCTPISTNVDYCPLNMVCTPINTNSGSSVIPAASNASYDVDVSSLTNLSKRDAIRQMYLSLQHREPDAPGWDYWTNNSSSLDSIKSQMKSGIEYTTHMKIVQIFNDVLHRNPTDLELIKWYYTAEYQNYNTDVVRSGIGGVSDGSNSDNGNNMLCDSSANFHSFGTNLTIGNSNDDVTSLQTWLIVQGYDIPLISSGKVAKGYFGPSTSAALGRYQAAKGLPASGELDVQTRAALNNGGCANPPAQAEAVHIDSISPTSGGEGTQITISGRGFRTTDTVQFELNSKVMGGLYGVSFQSITANKIVFTLSHLFVANVPPAAYQIRVAHTYAGTNTSNPMPFSVTSQVAQACTNSQIWNGIACVASSASNYPIIYSVSPSSGPWGTTITLIGNHFQVGSNNLQFQIPGPNGGVTTMTLRGNSIDGTHITLSLPASYYNVTSGTFKIFVDNDQYGFSDQNPAYYASPATFMLTSNGVAQSTITVLSPSSGSTWQIGSNYAIKWSDSSNNDTNTYYLYYVRRSGSNPVYGSIARIPNIYAGEYNWTVPQSIASYIGPNMQIAISTQPDNVLTPLPSSAATSNYFTIAAQNTDMQPVISNVTPASNVTLAPNAPITVGWNSNFPAGSVALLTVYLHSTTAVANDVVLAKDLTNINNVASWSGSILGFDGRAVAADTYNIYVGGSVNGHNINSHSAGILTVSAPAAAAPSARLTIEGAHEYTYVPGQTNQYYWSSANADTFSSSYTSTGGAVCGGGGWVANNATGQSSSVISTSYVGCVWTVTYTARNSQTGQSASDTVTVRVVAPGNNNASAAYDAWKALQDSIAANVAAWQRNNQ